MVRKLFGVSVGFGLLVACASSAFAANFDFVALAAGNEHGAASETFTDGGVSVTASGRSLDGLTSYYMYLDDVAGISDPAGLGVCKTGVGDCNSDDNLGYNEVLTLVFDQVVTITGITFSNGDHQDVYNGKFGVAIDSNPTTTADFTSFTQTAAFAGALTGQVFHFIANATFAGLAGSPDPDVIYISSLTAKPTAVPEPFTLGLTGLGAAIACARRRKMRVSC